MKFMVIGAGGIGGAIAAYLAAGGKETAIVARGAQLAAIRENGLKAKTVKLGDLRVDLTAYSPQDEPEKFDVIIVCVKGYSLMDTVAFIEKASHEKTVVIPIINSLNAGDKLGNALKGVCVLGGCIYTSSFISAPGEITQPTPLFRIVYGERKGSPADGALLEQIADELMECSIEVVVSPCIERDLFKKLMFISAFATTDTYYDANIGIIQRQGKEREMFTSLLGELKLISDAKALGMGPTVVEDALKMMDGFEPSVTSSMHKDYSAGKDIEKQELIFDIVETAKSLGVPVPEYEKAAKHFGYKGYEKN